MDLGAQLVIGVGGSFVFILIILLTLPWLENIKLKKPIKRKGILILSIFYVLIVLWYSFITPHLFDASYYLRRGFEPLSNLEMLGRRGILFFISLIYLWWLKCQ